jgi:tRNA threonylcarbamoyl adenosine modification protein YeaZ
MNFLSIDCSTSNSFLFIKNKNKTFSKILQSDKSKNDLIMKQILDFFKENNLKFADLHKIFVNQGPGNFSGLRGSIAISKGICLSKSLNLFGYDTFILSCANFLNKNESIFSILKIRDKYFVKKFSGNLRNISKIEETSEEKIIKKYNNKFKVIPKNMIKYFDNKILKLNNVNPVDLDYNQLEFLQLKGLLNENLIKPLYLS